MTDLSCFAGRKPDLIGEQNISHSAVIIPVIEKPEGTELLFEVRSEKLDHQPGDICFPGGRVEAGETFEEAAIREICEELLTEPSQIRMIGPADIFQGGTRYVHPFVSVISDYDGAFSRDEVSEVFTVPMDFFIEIDPEVHKVTMIPQFTPDFPFEKIHGGKKYPWSRQENDVLFYEYGGHVIWGMTAKIVQSFIAVLKG